MTDSTAPFAADSTETHLPSEFRVSQLRDLVETLRIADEIAEKRYLITSSELADLMDVNASAVTSRGDNWVWRNWIVSQYGARATKSSGSGTSGLRERLGTRD